MSQHDFNIADQTMPSARTDLNNALLALASQSAGASEPGTTYAYQPWLDTSATPWLLKVRNGANDAWITIMRVDDSDDTASIDAGNVDITDSGGYYTGTTAEAGLQEAAVLTQGQHTIWIPAGAFTPTTTNGAASATEELATNDVMVSGLDYDAATRENAQFSFQAPKSADTSAGLIFQAVWKDGATAGTGNVVWGFEALAVGDNDAMDAAFGTAVTVTDAFITSGDLHAAAESGAVTPSGSWASEDFLIVQVYRDAASGSDTYTQDARLIGVRIHYTTNANTDS